MSFNRDTASVTSLIRGKRYKMKNGLHSMKFSKYRV